MSEKIALIFPGQGSQSVGMGRDLAERYPAASETFVAADEMLGVALSKIAWEGPEEELNDTLNTQPALFVHSLAVLKILLEKIPDLFVEFVAGHSMGELSALVASRALSFEDGLKLVRTRGKLMKQAGEKSPGSMAAVLGLGINVLEQICKEASIGDDVVQVANDNSPGQVVISGSRGPLERSLALAKQHGAKRIIPLAVSIAAHSPLMKHAQIEFTQAVQLTPFSTPKIPIIGNVNARPLYTINDIQDDLQAQLTHRVRWTESINYMISEGVNMFIEIGNGTVLSGLVKRINKDVSTSTLSNPNDFDHLTELFS
jgi:[acyl-carrier-protein] S-malonyltransferase